MTDETVRLTYAELARARGVSIGAARRMVQRHRWPKQVGNDGLSRVSVPATFLVRSNSVDSDVAKDVAGDVARDVVTHGAANTFAVAIDVPSDAANDVAPDVAVDPLRLRLQVVSLGEALAAFSGVVKEVATDVAGDVAKDVIATLRDQLIIERERAERAEERVRELLEQRESEVAEYRRVVGVLADLSARRSWWPWRR